MTLRGADVSVAQGDVIVPMRRERNSFIEEFRSEFFVLYASRGRFSESAGNTKTLRAEVSRVRCDQSQSGIERAAACKDKGGHLSVLQMNGDLRLFRRR